MIGDIVYLYVTTLDGVIDVGFAKSTLNFCVDSKMLFYW